MTTKLLVCLALLGTAAAGPVSNRWPSEVTSSDSRDCALQCSDKETKFKYTTGTTYIYQYEVNTETSVAGSSEDSAILNIQTRAEIEVMSSCELSLRLKNTQVTHSDPYMRQMKTDRDSEFQQVFQRNPLRFSFDDGIITHICPEGYDDPWVLNFKRGLLSAFQNSMTDFEKNEKVSEIDVTGQCDEVEYNVSTSWAWRQRQTVVKKSKNLLSCSKRDSFKSILQMVPYSAPSDIQSMPFIKSTHTCQQKIDSEKIIQFASCEETHVFAPFSNSQNGARTDVNQTLTYQSKISRIDAIQGVVKNRQSLLFQHQNGNEEILRGQEYAEQKLKEICEITTYDIRPETPRLFAELVQIVKALDIADLKGVYQKLRKKSICPQSGKAMKFFIDTLPVAGTPGTVEMMLIIFKQNRINEVEKEAWLLSLSLINDPSDDMLPLMLKLLKEPMTHQALLPVSALVNNYCQKNANCADNYYISQLIDILDEKIDFYCTTNDKNKQMILRTLRAIGNIGNSRKFVQTIDRCIRSNYASLHIKISAVNAYRRIPCPDATKEADKTLMTVLQNKDEEPELRIAAYQALMRCPGDDVFSKVTKQLNSEENEEVAEYIYSHLNNLLKTSDPHKKDASRTLKRFNVMKKVEGNILRSSKNYESSMLINKFNLGYAADADLIWSKSSQIPRSFKANLTMDLFGNSINLLDFGGRMEGMEYLISLVAGDKYSPEGDMPWKPEDVKLCLYGRMFGNEMAFTHYEGDKDLPHTMQRFNFAQNLIKYSKKFDYDFSHSTQLFHGSLMIPTIAGLPLNLTMNSSASVHVGLKGKISANKILTKHRSFGVDVDAIGSAALEVTGTMSVDAFFRKIGLRTRITAHSSLPLKSRSSFSQAHGFIFELDAPEDKIELFNAKSEFFIIYDKYEKEQRMITDNRKEFKKCTGATLAKISGFEMCGDLQYPNASMKSDAPYFYLAGPSSISLILHKKDTHSGYKLFAKWDKKKQHTLAQLQLNTPGSQVNRLISTDVTIGYLKDKHVDVIINTPWKNLNLNGKLILSKSVKHIVGNFRIDNEEYGFTTKLVTKSSKKEMNYLPLVEIIYKGEIKTILSGEVKMAARNEIFLSLDLNGFYKPVGSIKGNLVNSGKAKKVSVELSPAGQAAYIFTAGSDVRVDKKGIKLTPTIILKSPEKSLINVNSNGEYRYNKFVKGKAAFSIHSLKPVTLAGHVDLNGSKDPKKAKSVMKAKLRVKSWAVNADVASGMTFGKKLMAGWLKAKYNIRTLGKDSVSLYGKFSDKSKVQFKQYKMTSGITFIENPDYNMRSFLDIHRKKQTKVTLKAHYGGDFKNKDKQVRVSVQLPSSIPNIKNVEAVGILTASVPEKKWDMSMKLNHLHNKAKIESKLNFHILPLVGKSAIVVQSKMDPRNFSLSGIYYKKNEKLYSLDLSSKMKNWNAASCSVDVKLQKRKIEASVNYQKYRVGMKGTASVNWNAGKKKEESSKISMMGSFKDSNVKKGRLVKGSLQLKSPFKNFENLNLKMNLDHQAKQLKSNGQFSWGGKQEQVTGNLITSLPLSLWQANMFFAFRSPFKGYRQMEMNIDHKLNENLMTALRGKVNGKEGRLEIKGSQDINGKLRNVAGELSLKTPFKNYREFSMKLDHSDDYKNAKTIASLSHNKRMFMANLDMMYEFKPSGKDCHSRGKLIASSPWQSVETTWSHNTENERREVTSKLQSTSDNKKLISVEASGSAMDMNSVELNIDMKTMLKSFRSVSLELSHKRRDDILNNKALLTNDRAKTGYILLLANGEDNSNVDIKLFLTPIYKRKISLRSNVNYGNYPMTASAQILWAPLSKVTYEGSLNAPSFDNFDLSSKLTTPFENYENIHMKSSIKKDSSELIGHLNVDYAVHKMVDIETRYRNDESMKLISAKITSPHPYVESFYSSIWLDTENKIKFKADIDLQSLEKYGSHVSFKKEDSNMRGGVQIITPIDGYSSIEANGAVDTKRDSKRTVHIDFKTTPSNVYSLDSSYKLKLPFELKIDIKTPHPEFDDVGLELSHDYTGSQVVSRGKITYLPKKTIEASLNLLYKRTKIIEGNLIVKTPFERFEENKLNIVHQGGPEDFTSRGSVLIAEGKASYDLKFQNVKSKTNADLSFTSSLEGLEKVKAYFKVKGIIEDLKTEASLEYRDKAMSTKFENRLKEDSLKSNFIINFPDGASAQISIDHEDNYNKSTRYSRKIKHKQVWRFGAEKAEIETEIDHKDIENTKAFMNFDSSFVPVFKVVKSNFQRKENGIHFSANVDTKSKYVQNVGLEFRTEGPVDNLNSLFNLTSFDHSILEIQIETNKVSDATMNGLVSINGIILPNLKTELRIDGDTSSFSATAQNAAISHEVNYKHSDNIKELNSLLKYKHFEEQHTNVIYFKRDESEDPGFTIKMKDFVNPDHVFGFELDHKGHFEKFTTSNQIHLGKFGTISGKLEFFKDGLERIAVDAGLTTPFKGLEDQSLKLRYESQETRVNTILNLAHAKWPKSKREIVVTLLLENSPHPIFSLSLASPNEDKVHVLLSTEIEDGKLTGKAQYEEDKFSVVGIYSDKSYPYHHYVHLVTPYPWLKELIINLRGQLLDGSADLTLLLNDNDNVEGRASLKFENLFSMAMMLSLDSTFERFDDLLVDLKNTEEPEIKKTALTLSLGPNKKVSVSGDLSANIYRQTLINKQLRLSVQLPIEEVQSMSLLLGGHYDTYIRGAQIKFDLNSEKVVDVDMNINSDPDADVKSASIVMQQPRMMEYRTTQKVDGDFIQWEHYINWNRNEPESNLRLIAKIKDLSDLSKIDNSVYITLIQSSRSIGCEYSLVLTPRKIFSDGKLFWNTDDDSAIFYHLEANDKSGRIFTFIDGDLTFGIPMRTMKLEGSLRDSYRQRASDLSFSWDVDNDMSKKIILNTKISGKDQMNADITLKLPAQVKVDSKLILFNGNTLFDGQTDISYSWDARKTLTLFSKVESNREQSTYIILPDTFQSFNYSIRFGIKHPDTKVDMTIDSHLGRNPNTLTGSVGVDYLTSYRQTKNMALWMEIDQIKKEINLLSTNPYKNIGITGTVMKEDPLSLKAIVTIDEEEKFQATLNQDTMLLRPTFNIEIGNSDNTLKMTASSPNESAIQLNLQHNVFDESYDVARVSIHPAASNVISADLNWKPGTLKQAQDQLIQIINQESEDMKKLLSEISVDLEKEIIRKYRSLTSALSEDSKPLLDFVTQEVETIAQQVDTYKGRWRRTVANNDFYLGNLTETFTEAFDGIQKISIVPVSSLMKPLNSLTGKIRQLRTYPFRRYCKQIILNLLTKTNNEIDEIVLALKQSIKDKNQQITKIIEYSKDFMVESAQDLMNHQRIQELIKGLQSLRQYDISPHIESMIETLKDNIGLIGESDVINIIRSNIQEIKDIISENEITKEALDILQKGSSEIYQQAKWAYDYWEVEDNIPDLIQSSVITLREVVEEEQMEYFYHFIHNPIKVYDPKNGNIEAKFILPIDIDELDEMPKLMDYIEERRNSILQNFNDFKQKWFSSEFNDTKKMKSHTENMTIYNI